MASGRSRKYDDVTVREARHEDYDDVMRIDRNIYDVSLIVRRLNDLVIRTCSCVDMCVVGV